MGGLKRVFCNVLTENQWPEIVSSRAILFCFATHVALGGANYCYNQFFVHRRSQAYRKEVFFITKLIISALPSQLNNDLSGNQRCIAIMSRLIKIKGGPINLRLGELPRKLR